MKNMIIAHNGSVQNIPTIPANVKAIYKTVWEISQKKVIDLSADRGAFICQSQSLNVHLSAPTLGQLTSMHFYGWKKGLKTGMYYLRTRPAAQAIQFTLDQSVLDSAKKQQADGKLQAAADAAAVVASGLGISGTGILTPASSSSSSPSPQHSPTTFASSVVEAVKIEPVTPSLSASPSPTIVSPDSLDGKTGEIDPEFAAALKRQADRKLEEEKLMCSLENKEACVMCSG